SCFVFLLLSRPPCSTLFPYTTLFRSVSRLARSNVDWHRLLQLCALTETLVIDEDGCYDPSDFNDGLLLGLKGAMAQAELHFLRRSEEHTSELQSPYDLVCRLLLEKKK